MNEFSGMNLLHPTMATEEEEFDFVPRPTGLHGLRIGLVENTKKNAEEVLRKLANKLCAHGMTIAALVHYPGLGAVPFSVVPLPVPSV